MIANYNEIIIPDDEIVIKNGDVYRKLFTLWHEDISPKEEGDLPVAPVPIDLMLTRTIPLPCFQIVWNMWDKLCVVLFNLTKTSVRVYITDGSWEQPLHVSVELILMDKEDGKGPRWAWEIMDKLTSPEVIRDKDVIENNVHLVMCLWYGIQVALLNPRLQVLLKNPTKEKVYTRQGKGKDRKRVVKYVRKHYITPEGIDEALYGKGHRDFDRKTMAWYVIGHWRQYKNGTRKFINGYWKGPLREMKRNLDGGRIRQLAIQEA